MQVLEENRTEVVNMIATKLGIQYEDLTLKKLIASIDHPVKKKLLAHRSTLLGQVKTIGELNECNQALVDTSSLSIKKSLAFIHKTELAAQEGYHADGQMNDSKTSSVMLSMEA
jgi:hypothetical protein